MGFFGIFSSAMADLKRQKMRIEKFNNRWDKLSGTHKLIIRDYVEPVFRNIDKLRDSEYALLSRYVKDMDGCHNAIKQNIKVANQRDLTKYATAIKETSLKAMKLCQKHHIKFGILSVEYDAQRKMIMLNNRDLYSLD